VDGYFTVELFLGSASFTGDARWLEIGVRPGELEDPNVYTILEPRQEVTPTPYAMYAKSSGTVTVPLELIGSVASTGAVISGTNTGSGHGGNFKSTFGTGRGVYGEASNSGSYINYGGYFLAEGSIGKGVYGEAPGSSGTGVYGKAGNTGYYTNFGGFFEAAGATARGVYGYATNTGNYTNYGGYFEAKGETARGVYGEATDIGDGTNYGGYFVARSKYGRAVYGNGTGESGWGVWGETSGKYGIGVQGTATGEYSFGVYGYAPGSSGRGVYGSGTAYGGYFVGDNDIADKNSYGLYTKATGLNGERYGLYSKVTTSSGLYNNNYGVYSEVANNADDFSSSYGFYADVDPGGTGWGVYVDLESTTASTTQQHGIACSVNHQGTTGSTKGVASYTDSSDTGNNYAGYFSASSRSGDTGKLYGIYARCDNDTSGSKYAGYFYKEGKGNYAGYFYGNVHVSGTLSKSSGSFKIDHPLDPENKYLQHSFIESPDMMNVYNGNVLLDEKGEACVQLPNYFETLNRDFRYQLTCIGGFAPVYIAEKISGNRFKIAGGKKAMEVSWQVTGVRQDAYAKANRIVVEENKPAEERGYYLHPTAYGLPEEKGIEAVHNARFPETRQVAKKVD
ncbi:MAG: autotransporter outer membrane beta-barrel domain-containing protein, partial [Planctomycetota bacterium]